MSEKRANSYTHISQLPGYVFKNVKIPVKITKIQAKFHEFSAP